MAQNKQGQEHHSSDSGLNELDLSSILALIKSYWRWILLAGFGGLFLALLLVIYQKPVYQADALIQVKADNSPTNGLLGKVGALAANLSQQASPAQIQQALLHSRYILSEVVNDLRLNISVEPYYFPLLGRHFIPKQMVHHLQKPKFGLSHYAWGGENIQIAHLNVPNNLVGEKLTLVKTSAKSYRLLDKEGELLVHGTFGQNTYQNGIYVNVRSMLARVGEPFTLIYDDPMTIVKLISKNLQIEDIGSQDGVNNTGVLQISLTWPSPYQLPRILNKVIEIGSQKNIIANSKNAAQSLTFIQQQIPRIKQQLLQAELALNKYQEQHHIVDMTDEAKMMLTQLGTQEQSLQSMQMQKALLLQSYTTQHPVILAMDDKIANLKDHIQETESKIQNLPSADQKALSLMRDVKIKEGIYTSLLQKTEELAVVKAGTIGDISILSLSTMPKKPLPAHKIKKLLLGFILGSLLGIAVFVIRRILMNVLLSASEVEKKISVPVQAVLPYCKKIINKQKNNKHATLLAKAFKDEPIVEAIRGLRTNLQLSLAVAPKKIVAVLGSTPGIGKTLLSTNLALVFADSGKKVLLVDTDMRRGQTKKAFKLKSDMGLSDYLMGGVNLDQVINHVDDTLDVIPSGTYTTKSNDLLLGSKFGEMLDELVPHYDYIILDTPPILALSDAVLVAKYAAANVFLVGLGKNKADEITAAVNRFKANNIPISLAACNYCSRVAVKDAAGTYEYYNYEYN